MTLARLTHSRGLAVRMAALVFSVVIALTCTRWATAGGDWLGAPPCINCLRTLPYVRAWSQKYEPHGLVVIGAHTPEFEFEHSIANVQRAVTDLGISYPVAVDGRQILWNAFGTRAWPTIYFVDAEGRVRYRQLGEGRYDQAERMIQQLLREAGRD